MEILKQNEQQHYLILITITWKQKVLVDLHWTGNINTNNNSIFAIYKIYNQYYIDCEVLSQIWKLSAKIGNDFQYFVIINYKKVQSKQISTKYKIDNNSISKFLTVLFSDQRCQSYKQLK